MAAHRPSDLEIYLRLLKEARPYWGVIIALFLIGLLATPIALLMPLPLKIVVDSVIGHEGLPAALRYLLPSGIQSSPAGLLVLAAAAVLGIALADQLQKMGVSILGAYVGEKLALDFRAKLFRHVQRLSLSYHDARGTAEAMYRIHWDAAAIQWVAVYGVTPFLGATMTLVGMFYITAALDWRLSLIALGVAPAVFLITLVSRRRLREGWRHTKALESLALGVIQEALSGLRVVKAFCQEDREQARFVRSSGQGMRARIGVAFAESAFELITGLTIAVGSAVVLFVGARHVQQGLLSLGELILVMGYLARLYLPLQEISKSVNLLQSSIASAERAFALLDEPPDVPEKVNARRLIRAKGEILFRNVSFAYGGEDHPVLHDVSFRVEPGSRVGITGTTGAGKTTLINLLMRFYEPNVGTILLDSVDLREYKLSDLRNQFSIVLQDPILFSASIFENIAYACPDAKEAGVIAAAMAANAHEFIMTLPDGYRTLLGERGMRLSGGQRQRIALARAFLKDAPVLLLDEPTSSVDLKTEVAIIEAIERLMNGRTTLMIAHRLNTLSRLDMRLVIENGRAAFRAAPAGSV